jgi:PKHD-type hydroxylase
MVRNNCWYWNKKLPHKTCQKLIKLGEGKWNEAQTYGSEEKNESLDVIRKSDIVWINDQQVYDLIWHYMMSANEEAGWKYDIVAAESCQITRYTKDGFYTWHKDGIGSHNEVYDNPEQPFLHGNTRKLSMSIVLNDEYEGGDFEMSGLKEPLPRLEKGSIIVFPSFIDHRVTPVTKGTRYSLVTWFVGPPFV